MIFSSGSYPAALPGSRTKRQNTRMHIYGFDARHRGASLTWQRVVGVGSEMQRDIMARQTNVDVRATSAERAVYFWQWAGNLAGSLQIRVRVGECRSARWSQRGIAVTISDHANSGLVPFSDSYTLYGVPQQPVYIARRRVESTAKHESALLCGRNVVVERELNQSFWTSPVFAEVRFTVEAGKPVKWTMK